MRPDIRSPSVAGSGSAAATTSRGATERASERRYNWPMDDFFSVPSGYADPDEKDAVSVASIPADAYEHPGKWLALSGGQVIAIKDTYGELRDELEDPSLKVSFFHVPTTAIYAL